MSDVMFYGILRMPYEMAMNDELSRRQFYSRVQEAATRVEIAEANVEELERSMKGKLEAARLAGVREGLEAAAKWHEDAVKPLNTHENAAAQLRRLADEQALPSVLTATDGPVLLTNRKTASIVERGYAIAGYVLRNKAGDYSLSAGSAVRWLPAAHYQRLMHEQNSTLFTVQTQDGTK